MASGYQLEVSKGIYKQDSLEEEIDVTDDEKEETRRVLYDYVFRRAEGDNILTRHQTDSFREAHLKSESNISSGGTNAQMVGRRLAELGDQIDAMYGEEIEDIMSLYENPQEAFKSFSHVVQNVFEWDENGLPKVNVGRIAAVLGYCYHLCRSYVQKYLNSYGLLSLLGMLAGFLVKFFLKAKFYEWLNRQGGWGQLLEMTAGGWLNSLGMGRNMFLILGIASLTIYAIQYFRGR